MSTTSTVSLNQTIVARIRTALGHARVYMSQAPDSAVFPYVVVRKINAVTDPQYNNLRENFDLEIMGFGRPRSSEPAVEAMMDLVVQSLLTWVESGSALGLSFGRISQRDTLPPVPDDRELVTVRVVIECATWPQYLTTVLD